MILRTRPERIAPRFAKCWWLVAWGVAVWVLASAGAIGQGAPSGSGRYLLGGTVRPGLPVAIHDARGGAWRGRWGTLHVEVRGNAAVLLWPEGAAPRLDGPGAPGPDAFRVARLSEAVIGVLPEAARRWRENAPRAAREVEAIAGALRRQVRCVDLEDSLRDLPAPVLAALDLVVALDRPELERLAAVREWVGLGGCAVVLAGDTGEPVGMGRVVTLSEVGAGSRSGLARVVAELAPLKPVPPPARTGPVRVWAGLACLLLLAAVGWGAGAGARRRFAGWGLALVVGGAVVLAFPSSAWTLRSSASIWCFPGEGGRAWVHSTQRVVPRGRTEADVEFATPGMVLTEVPSGARVDARPGRVRLTWRGPGEVAGLEARQLGGGIRVRRAGDRTLVSARLPAGIRLVDAHLIRPGEVRALGTLRAGSTVALEEAARVPPGGMPPYVRSLLSGLGRRPPPEGLILGVLRGEGLVGRHLAVAAAMREAP